MKHVRLAGAHKDKVGRRDGTCPLATVLSGVMTVIVTVVVVVSIAAPTDAGTERLHKMRAPRWRQGQRGIRVRACIETHRRRRARPMESAARDGRSLVGVPGKHAREKGARLGAHHGAAGCCGFGYGLGARFPRGRPRERRHHGLARQTREVAQDGARIGARRLVDERVAQGLRIGTRNGLSHRQRGARQRLSIVARKRVTASRLRRRAHRLIDERKDTQRSAHARDRPAQPCAVGLARRVAGRSTGSTVRDGHCEWSMSIRGQSGPNGSRPCLCVWGGA